MDLFTDQLVITDLPTATRLLTESRAGFLTLFNNSPICMSMTTTNPGRRVYKRVNNKFLEKFGYTEEEIIGRNSVEVGILDEAESIRVGNLIKENGRLQNEYIKCIAKDGSIVHTLSSIEMLEMNGEMHLISFFIDITKITRQQVVIEQQVQQLEAVNKELEAFSYSVSHDLRAPLRAIHGYGQMLEDKISSIIDDDAKRLLGNIRQNAKKMGILIDDLLNFSRLGKKPVNKSVIDMNLLVQDVLNEIKNAGAHRAEIKVGDLHPANGDHSLIKQVVVNLLSNGIKYSSKKEKPVVEITSEAQNNQVIYTVKDNGAGFDMQYANKLFGIFQRLHSDKDFEGTGVGLAMVQRIVNRHGGSIQANAEVGKGATFSFTLPVG